MLAPWHTKSQLWMLVAWKATFLENYSAVSAWIFNGSAIECHKKKPQPLTLNDWSWGGQWILFPENLNVSQDEVERNIGIWGKQNSLFPRGPVIKWFFIAKQHKSKFWKTCWDSSNNIRPLLITCNSGQHLVGNSFPFDVIIFVMLPAHGIWQETVSLLDVMWTWTSQWIGTL